MIHGPYMRLDINVSEDNYPADLNDIHSEISIDLRRQGQMKANKYNDNSRL
ncbi:MAG: hypothetical protein QF704_14650 [Anaerolineales bacterium]|nr:hypothetical protein [Anaerolineales bacterium]